MYKTAEYMKSVARLENLGDRLDKLVPHGIRHKPIGDKLLTEIDKEVNVLKDVVSDLKT